MLGNLLVQRLLLVVGVDVRLVLLSWLLLHFGGLSGNGLLVRILLSERRGDGVRHYIFVMSA